MPLTKKGAKILRKMKQTYGSKKGKQVFYASINKGKKGSSKWHKKNSPKRRMYHWEYPGQNQKVKRIKNS